MVNQLCIGFVPLVNKMIVANGKHGRGNGRLEAISGHDLERCARRVSSCTATAHTCLYPHLVREIGA